jgi:hypothetical protein
MKMRRSDEEDVCADEEAHCPLLFLFALFLLLVFAFGLRWEAEIGRWWRM